MGHRSDEDELIGRFRKGDERAFADLFGRYEDQVRRRLERWLPAKLQRRFSVSDALQEARIAALQQREQFEPRGPGSFRRWIIGIAEMRARNALRRHVAANKRGIYREVTRGMRGETAQVEARGPTPSEAAIASELADHVRVAFEALPDDYREVFRLCQQEHLPLREAGERMGRSYEAVKKLYGRALARFACELKRIRGESHG